MKIYRLRIILSCLWLGFWAITSALLLLTPVLRSDKMVTFPDSVSAMIQISGIWTVPIGCFIAFWFPNVGNAAHEKGSVNTAAAWFAVAITSIAMLILFVLLSAVVLAGDFSEVDAFGNALNGSLTEQLSDVVKYSQVFSSFLLAAVAYVTRSPVANQPQVRRPRANPGRGQQPRAESPEGNRSRAQNPPRAQLPQGDEPTNANPRAEEPAGESS